MIRGFLVGLPVVAYAFGILLTYSLGAVMHWRNVAWISIAIPCVTLTAIFFVPESPIWLVRKGRTEQAQRSLVWLRCDKHLAAAELADISNRFEAETTTQQTEQESFWSLISDMSAIKPLVIVNIFHVFTVLCGTYLMVFYVVDILKEIHLDIDMMHAAVYTATIRLVSTVACAILMYTHNRRTVLIGTSLIAAISCLFLVAFDYCRSDVLDKTPIDTYVPAVCILLYIATSSTLMIFPGVIISELLPARIRGKVSGMIVCLFYGMLFLVTKGFPYFVQMAKTQGVFLVFGLTCLVASIFVFAFLPETKGRTLGQIEDYFHGDNWIWANRSERSKRELKE